MERKPDDEAIAAFIEDLAQRLSLGHRERNWPRYLYHITDVHNAASILRTQRLLSRTAATARNVMAVDNANLGIIRHSDPRTLDHVRLYFRPRTPTFYRNEGIRPLGRREDGAHCPLPVALLFDAKQMLGMAASQFTDGGHNRHANPPNIGSDVEFLRNLPWDLIYTGNLLDRRLTHAERELIIHRQQAEVQIHGQLDLDALRYVYVRSPADRETLQSLVGPDATLPPPAQRILVPRGGLFFDRWSYVRGVDVHAGMVRITFNGDSETPGPFTLEIRYADPAGTLPSLVRTVNDFDAIAPYVLELPQEYASRPFRLTLTLDDSLAYQHDFDPVPAGSQLIS